MRDELTPLELSREIGESVDRIEEWRALDLIGRPGVGTFRSDDVQRARLVQLVLRRGIGIDAIVQAEREDHLIGRCVAAMFPAGVGATYTLAEAADRAGLPHDTARRFWEVAGLADQGDTLYEDDLQALERMKVALESGVPEEAMRQLARVYADALGRTAEVESRVFHFYVHDRLRGQGLAGSPLTAVVDASADRLLPLIEPTLLYFHRKGRLRAVREDAVLHAGEYAGRRQTTDVPGQLHAAIVFIDLTGFTALAEAMGDEMAARVLGRFSELVREGVRRWDGQVVKQIGDAFMLVFSEARSAVGCAADIGRMVARESHFPAVRTGIHAGPVLYREGDYLGTTVNVAARLAAEAHRHEILVTGAVRGEAAAVPDVEFTPRGRRSLRGLAEEIELFGVSRLEDRGIVRRIDPVCGMQLAPDEAAATLSLDGEERVFCSQQCLQRFVAAPDRYAATPARS